ncbi:hypothetical protein ACGEN4_02160 [Limosilactobacillus mucosae]|uniref:Uncharacterized protein n=1 Tax=Limosilactobacillus mucosae TaxID=97478 RepID=A0A7L9VND8_LIMMU|nr:hypothetical protein [Limosilactobacillus mucosae]QOL68903.1 hypothetical protein LM011_05440 [Limosilactobacillus mucosae]
MKKIKISETAVFIIGSLGIALLGADFPPPLGFWKIVAVISLVALIQWYYLDWLLERINSKKKPFDDGGNIRITWWYERSDNDCCFRSAEKRGCDLVGTDHTGYCSLWPVFLAG